MSSYSDIPSSKPLHQCKVLKQQGGGIFGSLGKLFKAAPILSTAASFAPGVGKLAAPILASQGLGKRKRVRRRKPQPQQGGLKLGALKSLAKAAVPILKQTKLVSRTLEKGGPKARLAGSMAKKAGFGRRRRRGGARRRKLVIPRSVPLAMTM